MAGTRSTAGPRKARRRKEVAHVCRAFDRARSVRRRLVGGWSTACTWLGIREHGVEIMPEAVATRAAVGFSTIFNDVWEGLLDPSIVPDHRILIASPPCQSWSAAGKGAGRRSLDDVLDLIATGAHHDRARLREVAAERGLDDRTALVLTPLAYISQFRPEFVALEQVPTVLPVWEAYVGELEAMGYSAKAEILNAEQYGREARCPLHDTAREDAASLSKARLGIADLAGMNTAEMEALLASNATEREAFVRSRHTVGLVRSGSPGTTADEEGWRSAWDVALLLRLAVVDAQDATWQKLASHLLQQVRQGFAILGGRVAGSSMSVDTSTFGSTKHTDGNTESLPSRLWDALCDLAKSYITSTEQLTTTPPKISQSSKTTDTTDHIMRMVGGPDSCGACDDWSVPQTRRRAILVARRDGVEVQLPVPTHSKYYSRNPEKLDEGVLPWISMAEALGWSMTERPYPTIATGTEAGGRQPGGFSLREKNEATDRPEWAFTRPATTIAGDSRCWPPGHKVNASDIKRLGERAAREKYGDRAGTRAVKLTEGEAAILQTFPMWPFERPAPTVVGTRRSEGGMLIGRQLADGTRRDVGGHQTAKGLRIGHLAGVRVSEQEGAQLQSFSRGFPFQGSKGKRFLQIGNAVPPLLALAVLNSLTHGVDGSHAP